MTQLGFTFYPKDWWTSETFYSLSPLERYIYLELLFMMYDNDGYICNDKAKVERRLGMKIEDSLWHKLMNLMVKNGEQIIHPSVNKRLRKTIANRENGALGGAPIGNSNALKQPKQPKKTTQNNPPLEREEEREVKSKEEKMLARAKVFYSSVAGFSRDYPKKMLREFYNYWTEPNKSRTKMKFELQQTWDLKRRLNTWASRDRDFIKPETETSPEKKKMLETLKAAKENYAR